MLCPSGYRVTLGWEVVGRAFGAPAMRLRCRTVRHWYISNEIAITLAALD